MITRGKKVFSHFHNEPLPVDVSKVKNTDSRKLYSSDSDLFVSYRECLVAKTFEEPEDEAGDGTASLPLRSNVSSILPLFLTNLEIAMFISLRLSTSVYGFRSTFYETARTPSHVLGWPTGIIYFVHVATRLSTFGRKTPYSVSEPLCIFS